MRRLWRRLLAGLGGVGGSGGLGMLAGYAIHDRNMAQVSAHPKPCGICEARDQARDDDR